MSNERTSAVNAFANRVAKYVTEEGDPGWSPYRCAVEAVTVAMGDAWHEVEAIGPPPPKDHRLASEVGGHPVIPLPVHWRMGAHGDPIAVFDHIVLHLHRDGSVTWDDQSQAYEASEASATPQVGGNDPNSPLETP